MEIMEPKTGNLHIMRYIEHYSDGLNFFSALSGQAKTLYPFLGTTFFDDFGRYMPLYPDCSFLTKIVVPLEYSSFQWRDERSPN